MNSGYQNQGHAPDLASLVVRRPVPSDHPRIMKLLALVNYHRIGGLEMASFPLEDAFVAEADGHVVGVAGYRILDAEEAKTTLMAVDPACRGKGVGLALQKARMDYLRGKGVRWLTTNCDDASVIEWYRRHFNYKPTGQTVPKEEDFGLSHVREWTTLRCAL